jgi:septal ring factor EnvC (AmiA/AmiB activator)
MIRSAYKNRNMYQRLLYILAADDFSQAYRRLNYYKIYAQQRQKQAILIEKTTNKLSDEVKALMEKMAQIEETRIDVSQEQVKLDSEKMLKNEVVKNLVKREKELVTTQKKFQSQADLLKNKIEQTIHEENLTGNDGSTTANNSPTMTREEVSLTDNFTAQQGKLPWPLEKGVISSEYGEHNHPDLKGIKVKNNGINIVTGLNSKARAVFDGEVTRVMVVPNFNNVVIIRHGEYLSVYSNLDNVFVTKGSKVSTGQEIGTLFAPVEKQKSELHFEIWKGKNQLNPAKWISSENH